MGKSSKLILYKHKNKGQTFCNAIPDRYREAAESKSKGKGQKRTK